jgi:predicted hydrocarbon binding protein
MGRKFNVIQVACRAMGHPACVWEFDKKPVG